MKYKNDDYEAQEATLDAEMERLGYHRIDSEWNDIRYSNDAHQVMAWNAVEEGLEWLEAQAEAIETEEATA